MKSSRLLLCAAAFGTALAPGFAAAQRPHEASWGLELRLGPYRPDPDGPTGEYNEAFFGTKEPLLKAVELDRYLGRFFGLYGVSLSIGHWSISGRTRTCTDTTGEVIACTPEAIEQGLSTAGSEQARLTLLPLALGVLYRFDLLHRELGIPVVPYGKAGLDYIFAWSGEGSETSDSTGSAGYHGALGVALNLDWIEPSASTRGKPFLDSYLFAEVLWLRADHFGESQRLDLSATSFQFGLSFNFD